MATSSSTFTIRPATEADFPAIVGIYNWAVNQTFATIDSEPLSVDEAQGWWDTHVRNNPVLVADDEGEVIGWARLLPWKQRGFDLIEDLVYVDPVHQGRGVGRQLLSSLLEEAGRLGYRSVVAAIASDNTAGTKLHQKLGFEVVGTLKAASYKFDRWMDITLVQRTL